MSSLSVLSRGSARVRRGAVVRGAALVGGVALAGLAGGVALVGRVAPAGPIGLAGGVALAGRTTMVPDRVTGAAGVAGSRVVPVLGGRPAGAPGVVRDSGRMASLGWVDDARRGVERVTGSW